MPSKSFTTSVPDESVVDDPIFFFIEGRTLKGKQVEPIRFDCLPIIQGAVLTLAIEKAEKGEEFALGFITDFIRHTLDEDEEERFEATVFRKDLIIEITTLGEIMYWLMEVYGKRPIGASSDSRPGPTETGPISEGAFGLPTAPRPNRSTRRSSSTSSTPSSSKTAVR